MRLVVDGLIALMLLAVLAAVLWHQRAQADRIGQVEATQRAIRTIESQALYHASLGQVDVTRRGYPFEIDPAWFTTRPVNHVGGGTSEWLESADDKDAARHQPHRITTGPDRAAFWYNAYRGVVRARVARQSSEQATVELYNLINGTSLRVGDVDWSASG